MKKFWLFKILYFYPAIILLAQTGNSFFLFNTVKETHYQVKEIKGINSDKNNEFCPVLYQNNLLFVSDREYDYNTWGEKKWKKRKILNMYKSLAGDNITDSTEFSEAKIFDEKLVYINHTGPLIISAAGDEIIFTRVNKIRGKTNYPALYSMKKVNNKWKQPQKLSFVSDEYIYAHPAFSENGKYLYFASNMPGTMGGTDIFYCERKEDGTWSLPVNCGENINTPYNEVFPAIYQNHLYFSSNRPQSYGNLDFYRSELNNNAFSAAINLGNTINTPYDDFGICFLPDNQTGFFSSNRNGSDDIFYFKTIEKVTVISKDLIGNFTYKKLNTIASGLDFLLLDDEGNIISQNVTDSNGNFVFRHLDANKNYYLKLLNANDDYILAFYDQNKNELVRLTNDKQGYFTYKKLNADYFTVLSLIEAEDIVMNKATLSGQFIYEKLPQLYPAEQQVLLLDDKGNIIQTTKTDKYGNFTFKELSLQTQYLLKLEGNSDDDVVLLIYNNANNVTAEFKRNKQGNFVYRKLNSQYYNMLRLLEVNDDTLVMNKKSVTIAGYFNYKNSDKNVAGMKFYVLDDKGNKITESVSNENGYFRVRGLPLLDKYIFQIDENDPNYSKSIYLNIISRLAKPLSLLESDSKGRFIYRKLKEQYFELSEKQLDDNVKLITNKQSIKIYFDFNKHQFNNTYHKDLDLIALDMKNNPNLRLLVAGHADSRGTEQYNLNLSRLRAEAVKKYLLKHNIPSHRVQVQFYGDSKPSVNCKTDKECDEYLHKENRRCELVFLNN